MSKTLSIWIITTGEHFPIIDGKNVRLWRSVLLTESLISKGHEVVRWSSGFEHTKKIHRYDKHKSYIVNKSYTIEFIKSPGYKSNISIQRIYDHIVTARKFSELANLKSKPDLILCSLPTIELCNAATEYGIVNKVPVILDARDLWPDIFIESFPKGSKYLGKLLLSPLTNAAKKACKNAFALSGISESYVDWELKLAGRNKTERDKYFPHAYPEVVPPEKEQIAAYQFWESFNLNCTFNICLFSAMGNVLNMDPIFESARILSRKNVNVKFILCGDGVSLVDFKKASQDLDNVIFPGWVDVNQIWTLMRMSNVGILPYFDIENYKRNIPNKPIEYLSAGLPILTGVSGMVQELVETNSCGFHYSNGEELAQIITRLNKDESSLSIYSRNALEVFKSNYSARKVYGEMADHLVELSYLYKNENS